MADFTIISADSHVSEPPNLWLERMERKYRERAPRIERYGDSDCFVYEGQAAPHPIGLGVMAGKKPEEFKAMGVKLEDCRPGGWDTQARIADQKIDGLDAEVVYPTLGMGLYVMPDAELKAVSLRAYNDWLAEFCAPAANRLIGAALLPVDDVEVAVEELRRTREKGLKGALIPASPPPNRNYNDPAWDPLWAAACDFDVPLSLHIGSGKKFVISPGQGAAEIMITMEPLSMQEPVATFIWGAVFERFPKLRIVSVESGVGWLGYLLERMDHVYLKHRFWTQSALKKPPSEYFYDHVYATFQEDRIGMKIALDVGAHNLMWANDYPHTDTTWPESRKVIDEHFRDFPVEARDQIVGGNAARIYHLS
jgi:predicted TIM-barrel fold metal-dependent hydrolase